MTQLEIQHYLANSLSEKKGRGVFLVSIDGVDTSGKTTLAKALADMITQGYGVSCSLLSIDGFHNPEAVRKKNGDLSGKVYYYDSFNYAGLIETVLKPIRLGMMQVRKRIFDYRTDQAIDNEWLEMQPGSILLFEGVFLNRPELKDYWDFRIFMDISFETMLRRAESRDGYLFGEKENILKRYREKYIPGQKIYLGQCHPRDYADIVIDNNDYEHPIIMREKAGE